MQGILGAENLTITYDIGTPKAFTALKGVSFHGNPGELIIVFGPSGCGKSTLLYAMSGIERHITGGSAWINDKDIVKADISGLLAIHRHDLGMIFQAYNLVGTLSVLRNVTLPLIAVGVSKKQRKERAMALLERLGVAHLAYRYPSELSGGQQQRVAIARSLVTEPDIIFADEPTGNLDSASTEVVLKQILELRNRDKKTILMVTHDPSFLNYADRIVYLKDGNLVKIVEQKGQREFTFVSASTMASNASETGLPGVGIPVELPEQQFGSSPFDKEPVGEFSFEENRKIQITRQFVFGGSKEVPGVLENRLAHILTEIALGKLASKNALFVMQKPVVDGGLGLLLETAAEKLLEMEKLFEIRKHISNTPPEKRFSLDSLLHISRWLLGSLFQKVTSAQFVIFTKGISRYLLSQIDHSELSFIVKSSLEHGGAGMFGVEMSAIVNKLELISDLFPPDGQLEEEVVSE